MNKLRTTSFWLGLSSGVVLILDCLSKIIGLDLYSKEVEVVVLSVCSILVTIGIVTKKKVDDNKDSTKEELLEEIDENLKK